MATEKQTETRMKNFTKLRLKGAVCAINYALDNVKLYDRCREHLHDAYISLATAIKLWEVKGDEHDG